MNNCQNLTEVTRARARAIKRTRTHDVGLFVVLMFTHLQYMEDTHTIIYRTIGCTFE